MAAALCVAVRHQVVEQADSQFHDVFKHKIQAALDETSIFDIGSYGWLNENDPDPEFIGHAMWQVDAPLLDHSALFGDGPVQRRPKDIEKEILTSGEDFEGLMAASRLSIGLALIWKRQAQGNPINESAFFWLHHTDAFLKLAIASDRLRDLLVIACTGAAPKRYKKGTGDPPLTYVTPFDNAGVLITKRGIVDQRLSKPLAALPDVARKLAKFRVQRNAIVHDVATRMAEFVGNTVTVLQERYDQQQTEGSQPKVTNGAERFKRGKERRAEIELEIDHAMEEIKEWYTLLIQASNYVFQVEYWTRHYGATRLSV